MKRALVTGITGQDGSYLAELLLAKGYEVWGTVRRASTENFERIAHVRDRVRLLQADLLDPSSLQQALETARPHEVYNLAAQSFVPTSWVQPVLTGEFTALGVTRLLEAVRRFDPTIRYYQASSSEMFGKVQETPQRETTPFYPRSPYGVAKVYAHWITVNYRESYGLFAVSGILFNHECVTAETPVFVRRDGLLDLLPIEDVVPHRTDPHAGTRYTTEPSEPLDVWDAEGWTPVTCMTATWNGPPDRPRKGVCRIAARGALFHATEDHVVFAAANGRPAERRAAEVKVGDRLRLIDPPPPTDVITMTEDEAWLLGILVAEGSIDEEGRIVVTNQDPALLDEVEARWRRVAGGGTSRYVAPSGFEGGGPVTQLRLTGSHAYGRYLRESIYTRSKEKRIPMRVLNAGPEARTAFLRGYNAGDGLRSTPCTYEFQGFKSASAVLAAGLYWLATTTLGQRAILCPEGRNGRLYYQLNLNSPAASGKGKHLVRPLEEVVRAESIPYGGWLFDLATRTGTFHAGIGQGWIHNSPRRGLEFVTRKVTDGVARIKAGKAKELRLGNLGARRDWGYAGDYVEMMWRMLQHDEPGDYVIATGVAHSVRDLVETAFSYAGLDAREHVVEDPTLLRPAEVEHLVGDPSKAKRLLGWEPRVDFRGLVEMMVDADMKRHGLRPKVDRGPNP